MDEDSRSKGGQGSSSAGCTRRSFVGSVPGTSGSHRLAIRVSTLYLLSGGGTRSDWVRNLTRTSVVRVRVGVDEYAGTARIVTDPQEDRLARDAVHDKYAARYFGDLTSWRETALPVAVDLDPSRMG